MSTAVTTDPIADMLTRLRNGAAVGKRSVSVPHSKLKVELLKLLKQSQFIVDYKVSKSAAKEIEVILRPDGANSPISTIRRVSKPGRRVYVKSADIPRLMRGHGLVVMSTSDGIISGEAARRRGIGGELICEVT